MPAERTRKVPSRASHPLASTPEIRSTASNAVFGHTAPGVLDLHALQVTDKPSLFDLSSLDSPDTIGLPEGRKRNGDMKKPPNHFIVFRALATRKLSKEQAGKLVMGISTAVSTIWNCLTEAEKQPFIRRAGELKNLHERECAFKRDVKQVEAPSSTPTTDTHEPSFDISSFWNHAESPAGHSSYPTPWLASHHNPAQVGMTLSETWDSGPHEVPPHNTKATSSDQPMDESDAKPFADDSTSSGDSTVYVPKILYGGEAPSGASTSMGAYWYPTENSAFLFPVRTQEASGLSTWGYDELMGFEAH
ncbi:hypothetical protein D9611_015044 [Ephemerocybe angulata]|uniref:HMG box domain-containing protein n=1 Tax=Ephemerocybe angulata TaxID=980116 RepID=A0A8H5C9X1_9AGAR|nr:hypothetical protein D9611_007535 [Tulosesus angulatus]KAF5337805.1 hypothetical protein D9611_015044 [Tulosesus angulatus]